jgi:hypothetical protein
VEAEVEALRAEAEVLKIQALSHHWSSCISNSGLLPFGFLVNPTLENQFGILVNPGLKNRFPTIVPLQKSCTIYVAIDCL